MKSSILAALLFVHCIQAFAQEGVFCTPSLVRYSGYDLILQLEKSEQGFEGQVVRLELSGHPNIVSDQVVFREPVTISFQGDSLDVHGKLFALQMGGLSDLPGFGSFAEKVNGSSTSSFTSIGISRFSGPSNESEFVDLVCRSGSYKDRLAGNSNFLTWGMGVAI